VFADRIGNGLAVVRAGEREVARAGDGQTVGLDEAGPYEVVRRGEARERYCKGDFAYGTDRGVDLRTGVGDRPL